MAKRKVSRPSLPGVPDDQAGGTGGTGETDDDTGSAESDDNSDAPADGESDDEPAGEEPKAQPDAEQTPPEQPKPPVDSRQGTSARVRCVVVGTIMQGGRELERGHEMEVSRADFDRMNSGGKHLKELQ